MKLMHFALGVTSFAFGSLVQAGVLFPTKVIDISFDGYCDGMHLTINHSTGIVSGNSIGCVSDPAIGTAGGLSRIGAGLTVMNRGYLFVIDDNARNWTLYNSDGSLNSNGTYSVGVPAFTEGQSARPTGSR